MLKLKNGLFAFLLLSSVVVTAQKRLCTQSEFNFAEQHGGAAKQWGYAPSGETVYGALYWVCVVNPSTETFENRLKKYLELAYNKVSKKK